MAGKGRGRPARYVGPQVVTTVRMPAAMWEWVKKHRLEFSPLLVSKIQELMRLEEDRTREEQVRAILQAQRSPGEQAFRAWIVERQQSGDPPTADEIEAKRAEFAT